MRPRFAVPALLLTMLAVAAAPTIAGARVHRLTINASPNPIITGEEVLIYGQLNSQHSANKQIVLWHRVPPAQVFTPVQVTKTNRFGFYEFTRAEGVIPTNRSWFVTSPGGFQSRAVNERVAAAVTLTADQTTADTNHPIVFSGQVSPNHAGEQVLLQSQEGLTGDEWRTIGHGMLDANSRYSITHRFAIPAERDVRVVFRGDIRNTKAESDTVAVTVQQTQNPQFTINSSAPIIDDGQSATLSGVLYKPTPVVTPQVPGAPDPNVNVTLYAHGHGQLFQAVAQTTTNALGQYSFGQMPSQNEVYIVRVTSKPGRHTAQLFEGVRDVVSIQASSTTSEVGQTVTFTGGVTPDKTGHVIHLQRRGPDGDWHNVKKAVVHPGSIYKFTWKFGSPGVKHFRVLIQGGPVNLDGHSAPVDITVLLPAVQTLPTVPANPVTP
jgi:hypothetical protein